VNVQLGNPDTSRARARWWGPDGRVLQVVLTDQHTVPEADELAGWLDAARRAGATTVRTGALFPAAATSFAHSGFGVIDTLALLSIDLGQPPVEATITTGTSNSTARIGPLRRRHDPAAADIDRRAFGTPWANDIDELDEIRRATPIHRARGRFATGSGWRRPLLAFAIAGAAAGQGYLQRLAVDPAHHHEGHGRALTQDALAWMRRRRLRQGFVNTAVTNEAALALYTSVGFHTLDDQLVVMERAVGG
jgi:ribosomal protein S18 acetylase RimI-like enzyme